ncbi:MAG: helix-turn-helix domain-containing protein [Nocardiopsaceae bacterium]|nr:helix-turn-helix domain-containing protein [Nocardiopsaceae bacterium]
MPGGRLTQEDRRRIAACLAEGLSHAEIGRRLSRPTSTITREVNRNRGPAGYQADRAQRATRQRARRHHPARAPAAAPPGPRTDGRDPAAVSRFEQLYTDALAQMGMPRMICRVLTCLTTTDSGSMTSAELVQRLQVSPASISKAIGFLEDQQLLRRERDGRSERYIVDDDLWYRATLASGYTNNAFAEAALEGAEVLGADTPAGARLAMTGRFLKCLGDDLLGRSEYWYAVTFGRGQTEAAERVARTRRESGSRKGQRPAS